MNVERILPNYEQDGIVSLQMFRSVEWLHTLRRMIASSVRDIALTLEASEVTLEGDGITARNLCRMLEHGDAIIHHCHTILRSEPNWTDSLRCGLLMVYRRAHTQTDPAMKAAFEQARALAQ